MRRFGTFSELTEKGGWSAAQQHRLTLRKIDIDSDAALVEYGLCVPVVVIDGRVRFRGVVNSVLLERMLGDAGDGV